MLGPGESGEEHKLRVFLCSSGTVSGTNNVDKIKKINNTVVKKWLKIILHLKTKKAFQDCRKPTYSSKIYSTKKSVQYGTVPPSK